MLLASSDCPPTARDAFLTGFMTHIKPQVEFNFNLRCVDFSPKSFYALRMNEAEDNSRGMTPGQQIKAALIAAGRSQSWLAEQCKVSNNAVSKWIRTGKVDKTNIALLCKNTGINPSVFLDTPPEATEHMIERAGDEDASDLAKSLRRTVMAIAREWGVDPQDLTDLQTRALPVQVRS